MTTRSDATANVRLDAAAPASSGRDRRAPRMRREWRVVALPSEHGGWGLTLEPIVLGLLIAPGAAGVALGVAAMVAFMARTPVKLVLVDRWRHRTLPRTRLAGRIAAVELIVLTLLVAVAARTATAPFWVPFVAAVPLIGLELWFDMRSRSRRLIPELAGTIGIGAVAAAIVLADDGATTVAAGAWLLVAARATASLPFVRYQLRRAKRQPSRRWAQDVAQGAALALALTGVALGWLPWPAAVALGLLVLVQFVLSRIPPPKAAIVGVQQLIFGLAVMIAAGLTMA